LRHQFPSPLISLSAVYLICINLPNLLLIIASQ